MWLWAVAGVLLFVGLVLIALRIARAVQREVDREKQKVQSGENSRASQYAWLGHIHGYWLLIGLAVAKLKYIYKEWKTAPEGSLEQYAWGLILALIAAVAMFAVVRLVDRKLNGPIEMPGAESAGSSVET